MFSTRIASDLTPNRLSAAVARLREAGIAFDDLTESNPTRVGIDYPARLLEALAQPAGLALRARAVRPAVRARRGGRATSAAAA